MIGKVALHITCTEKTKIEILQNISHFYNFGIRQFVIVRGDGRIVPNGFRYASELITTLRCNFIDVAIYIAGYPEKPSEIEFTKLKIQLGVNACITQICFDNTKIVEFAQQLHLSVLPGVILPTDKSLEFAAKLGVFVPQARDPTVFLKTQVTELISSGFNHIHFYTLNNLDNLLFLFYDNI